MINIIRASKKRKSRAAALLNIFYFSLYDIGMARKSAHRFGIHDFLQFQSFKCLRSSIFLPLYADPGGRAHPARPPYSLSDLSWLTCFFLFFPTKSSFLPSKLGKPLCSTACMNILFVSNFCLLILLIRSHGKICPLPTIDNSTNMRDRHCWQWANFTMGSMS